MFLLFLRADENYRFPKADENPSPQSGINGLKTQRGISYETGVQWDLKKLLSKFSIYQLNLENEIAFDPTQTPQNPFGTNRNLNPTVRRGLSFIEKYHKNKNILFWHDLATSHYADICTSFLKEKNINFVEKNKNDPNVPQVHPIERFWAIMKRRYAVRQNCAKNLNSFKRIWKKLEEEAWQNCGKTIMTNLKKKLRIIGRE